MKPEQAKALREPFPSERVGKLPRIWCGACRDDRFKVCDKHRKSKCQDCHNNITDAHLHLDYVGHADVTDRLLEVDPSWTWEPLAYGPDGLPAMDRFGGMWMKLTVAGVTRLGYGDAGGKQGPDAVKEAIGDGLRNSAMRFGVALDLWSKTREEEGRDPSGHRRPPAFHEGTSRHAPEEPAEPMPTDEQVEEFGRFRLEIKVATAVGLAALVPEIKAAAEEYRITDSQNHRLAQLWQARKAELEAKEPGADPAPEGEAQ